MKVSEIYAELGLKLSGDSKSNLEEFEKSLLGIANAAKQAVAALAQLSTMRVPRNLRTTSAPQQNQPNSAQAPGATTVPAATPGPAQNQPNPAQNPPATADKPNQVARALMFGLKALGLGTLLIAVKKLISAMVNWVSASAKAAVSTELFTRQTGLSRKTMMEWELAAQKAGLAEGEAADAMAGLKQKWVQMQMTGEGAAAFSILGVDPSAGPAKIFQQFREASKNMSEAQAVFFGEALGFSKNFAAFLHSFKGEPASLKGLTLSDKEQKDVVELNAAWTEMTFKLGLLRDKIVADLSPALSGLIDKVTSVVDYLTANKDVRNSTLKTLGAMSVAPMAGIYGSGVMSYETLKNLFGYNAGSAGGSTTITNNISGVMDPEGVRRAAEQGTQDAMRKSTGSAYSQRYQLLGGPVPATQ